MCIGIGGGTSRTPPPAPPPKDKDPVYMRNPYLDGLGIGAENSGRNSLRIDPGSPVPNSSAPFLGIDPNPPANPAGPPGPRGRNRTRRFDGGSGLNLGIT